MPRGLAVDINTLYNPYIKTLDDGTLLIQPATAEAYCNRDWDFPYKIDHDDLCFKLFTEAGFDWGGDWDNRKDYQHFELIEPQPTDTWDAETGTLTVNSNPGKNAYKGRTDIVSVVFSDAVTSIGDGAFYDCRFGVIDIPASVRSIGSEAFAAEDSELQTVTIYAKACSFDNHPFPQSIMTDIYVPAESEDSYKVQNPYYARQIKAIPEAQQTDNVIAWSRALCRYIWVMLPYNHEGKIAAAHNTQGGITITFTGAVNEGGFNMWYISLLQSEKLTFTSTVGNISQITIQAEPYEEDEEPDIPVAEGWTWDAAKRTFTWQGTPSATVEMLASEEIELENVQIQFTID